MNRVPYSELSYDEGDGRYYLNNVPFTGVSFTLFQDGTLASEGGMREGVECGMARAWFQSGLLELEREIECGVLHGRCREWHANGTLAVDEHWEMGICLSRRSWAADGTQMEDWTLQTSDPGYRTLQAKRRSSQANWFTPKMDSAKGNAAPDTGRI